MPSYSDFRAFLKPSGSNPEIDSVYYELASQEKIKDLWNCEVLTLGFKKGNFYSKLRFRPIDPTKPMVFAIADPTDGCYFVVVDGHIGVKKPEGGMFNYKPFRTDDYLVDCHEGLGSSLGKHDYWSITSEGMTFVYGDVIFPETWILGGCDLLCAFVGGEFTANQLRMKAVFTEREAEKEARREAHIQRLSLKLREVASDASAAHHDLSRATNRYERLVRKLKSATDGILPFIGKANLLKVIEENG